MKQSSRSTEVSVVFPRLVLAVIFSRRGLVPVGAGGGGGGAPRSRKHPPPQKVGEEGGRVG